MQVGVARRGEKMRVGLVVEFDLGALDVRQGTREAAHAGGDGALLFENRAGDEQRLVEKVEFHAQFFQQRVLPQLPGRILSPGGDRAVIGGGKDVLCFVVGQVRGEMRGRAIHHADIAVVQAIPVGVFTFRQWREARGRAVIRAAERVGIVQLYQVAAQAVEHAPLRRELHPMFEEYSGVLQIRIDGTVQESRDRISIGARGSLKTSRKPPLRMIEGRIEEECSGRRPAPMPGKSRCWGSGTDRRRSPAR